MRFWKQITTGKDNATFDIVRVLLAGFGVALFVVLVWGVTLYTVGWFINKPFDIVAPFTAIQAYVVGAGAFLTGGGVAIYLKRSTEPDGTTTETTSTTRD